MLTEDDVVVPATGGWFLLYPIADSVLQPPPWRALPVIGWINYGDRLVPVTIPQHDGTTSTGLMGGRLWHVDVRTATDEKQLIGQLKREISVTV